MARVLVTDGEQRSALAVVRSLGRAGHHVYVAALKERSIAGASRYARASAALPDPLRAPGDFATALLGQARTWNVDVVLPVTEASALAILPRREEFSAVIPFPALSIFERICDKALVAETAAAVGLMVPAQIRLASARDRVIENGKPAYPLVVKPSRSVFGGAGQRSKLTVRHVSNDEQLAAVLTDMPAEAYPVLLQERIEGPGIGVFLLMHGGEAVARFCHERIREKPVSGGVSVYRRSIPADEALVTASVELLRRLEWQGAAMIEYKVDVRTGTCYIMEINGRFWGSLQLAIDAGVDFPALLVAAALGSQPEPVLTYREDVYSRWFWGDVDHLLMRLLKPETELGLPAGTPGRARAIIEFLRAFGPRNRSEIARLSDPAPAIQESMEWLTRRQEKT